ncbi:hypothetical protein DUI87_15647 [Hirundo rustica rustica]|uniref:Small-subunit processome Utp12 domain-containing protein n=1 Tax=Hirundo rustica rustica TaxID=333673 RepID=A0A3M0KGG9_HIRRU|nr:hypothetical protein DUI87_15647 [Hirundo rustica rustica]
MTEFGSMALIDEGGGGDEGVAIPLPGVKRGDMSYRHFKPEIRVTCVRFCPTGRSWAATTTEGLLLYSLDSGLIFDPFELDTDVTPSNIRKTLAQKEYTVAIVMAFKLNEKKLIQEVIEAVPSSEVDVVCSSLPDLYVEKLLEFLASAFETSCHLEFYLIWAHKLLMLHGQKLKTSCEWNIYNIKYALAISQQRGMKRLAEETPGDEEELDSDSDYLMQEAHKDKLSS